MLKINGLTFVLSKTDVNEDVDFKECLVKKIGLQLEAEDFYITLNGRIVNHGDELVCGEPYRLVPRLVGGKGGFGSMLRALGAQIEKTTNREACRDLSGRRMRDVNNEKKLREWAAKGKHIDKELEKAKRRKEKRERMKKVPTHTFEDEKYHEQRTQIAESIEDAVNHAFSKGTKRKAPAPKANPKIAKQWLGVELDDDDDDSDDDDDNNKSIIPTTTNSSTNDGQCSSSSNNGKQTDVHEEDDDDSCDADDDSDDDYDSDSNDEADESKDTADKCTNEPSSSNSSCSSNNNYSDQNCLPTSGSKEDGNKGQGQNGTTTAAACAPCSSGSNSGKNNGNKNSSSNKNSNSNENQNGGSHDCQTSNKTSNCEQNVGTVTKINDTDIM